MNPGPGPSSTYTTNLTESCSKVGVSLLCHGRRKPMVAASAELNSKNGGSGSSVSAWSIKSLVIKSRSRLIWSLRGSARTGSSSGMRGFDTLPSRHWNSFGVHLPVVAWRHASSTGSGLNQFVPGIVHLPFQPLTTRSGPITTASRVVRMPLRTSIVTSLERAASAIHLGCPSTESMRKTRTWAAVTATARSRPKGGRLNRSVFKVPPSPASIGSSGPSR